MQEFLSSDVGAWAIIAGPGLLVALLLIAAGSNGLRASGGAAFVTFLLLVSVIAALGAGSAFRSC